MGAENIQPPSIEYNPAGLIRPEPIPLHGLPRSICARVTSNVYASLKIWILRIFKGGWIYMGNFALCSGPSGI